MKKITVGNFETTALKTFGYIYLSSFGALWLLIEPLGTFGIAPKSISTLGFIGYISLFVISLILALVLCRIWKNVIFLRQELVILKVESRLEGIDYLVKAPANLQVTDFSHLFVERLEKGKASEKVKQLRRGFSPVLNVRRNEDKFELDDNITLKEAGFLETDVLFITGKPIKVDNTPRFSKTSDFE